MGTAIGDILGYAVGVAISPIPIIALILMLFSRSAAKNSVAFLLSWLVGLVGISVVVLALGVEASGGADDNGGGAVKIVIGALFLVLGVRQWRTRPRAGEEPELPKWMSTIDDLRPGRAVGLGLLLTVPNPKNLGLTVAAAASIGAQGLSGGEEAVAVGVFVLLASITIIAPVVIYLAARERAEPMLESWKDWLTANHHTVMTVLFAVIGAKVLGDGIVAVS